MPGGGNRAQPSAGLQAGPPAGQFEDVGLHVVCTASIFVGRVRQCFSAVSDGLTCLAGERPVVDDKQARVAETLKKLHRGDMDIIAYEDEHKFDGDGDEPA